MDNLEWFESNGFLIWVARSLLFHADTQRKITDLYKKNKPLYYRVAKENEFNDAILKPRGKIRDMIAFRQNLGVLLVARDDESLRKKIVDAMYAAHPKIKPYLNNPQKNADLEETIMYNLEKGAQSYTRPMSYMIRHVSVMIFISYIYAYSGKEDKLECRLAEMSKMLSKMPIWSGELKDTEQWTVRDILTNLELSKEDWELIKSMRGGETVTMYRGAFNCGEDDDTYELEYIPELDKYYDDEQSFIMLSFSDAVYNIMRDAGLNWDELFGNTPVAKKDKLRIMESSALYGMECGGYKPQHFLVAMVIFMLAKEVSNMNEYFFENDAEEKSLEVQRLSDLGEDYQRQIDALRKENERLKSSIGEKEKQSLTEYKSAEKAFKRQLDTLTKQNEDLEHQLSETKKSLAELELLRRYALEEVSEETDAADPGYDLNALLQGKRIVVIGGHIGWRNKLKSRFPALSVFDGSSIALDLKTLDNADKIFFYTSYMSHKAYERAINYTKSRDIPYGFLRPATNIEMIEKQLCGQLKQQ